MSLPYHNPEKVKKVYELIFKQGKSVRETAKLIGASKSSVGRIAIQIRKGHIKFADGEPYWTFNPSPPR